MMFGKYNFKCILENDAVLPPYKGSTFRGVFGHALKKVVCALKRQECEDCLLKQRCVYALVFETCKVLTHPEGSRIASPPPPYVIEPPVTSKTHFPPESSFDFNLLLFGEINNNLPYFIYAFDKMGKIGIGKKIEGRRGKFALKQVKCGNTVIYLDVDRKLNIQDLPASLYLAEPESTDCMESSFKLKITLQTPLRLKFKNRLKADLPFHVLVRAMQRRVSSLCNFYDGGEPLLDYRGLVQRAEKVKTINCDLKWFDWRRYSHRQDREMLMGGMIGSITYEGKIGEYMPLVEFCSKVHIGKQTSFGLGKILKDTV